MLHPSTPDPPNPDNPNFADDSNLHCALQRCCDRGPEETIQKHQLFGSRMWNREAEVLHEHEVDQECLRPPVAVH